MADTTSITGGLSSRRLVRRPTDGGRLIGTGGAAVHLARHLVSSLHQCQLVFYRGVWWCSSPDPNLSLTPEDGLGPKIRAYSPFSSLRRLLRRLRLF